MLTLIIKVNMKKLFRLFLFAIGMVLTSAIFSTSVFAAQSNYTEVEFNQLQKEGKSILVVVHAPWCPTCRAQAPIINELLSENEFKEINALRVDFDSQKDILKKLNVSKQSTLIVFKGGKEVARSTGDTSLWNIEKLLKRLPKS
jgi:thiol-disulfide isomerase/thioredoxin